MSEVTEARQERPAGLCCAAKRCTQPCRMRRSRAVSGLSKGIRESLAIPHARQPMIPGPALRPRARGRLFDRCAGPSYAARPNKRRANNHSVRMPPGSATVISVSAHRVITSDGSNGGESAEMNFSLCDESFST